MAKKAKASGEIEHTFDNQGLHDAKVTLDTLAKERQYRDTQTKVDVSRLQLQFRHAFEPIKVALEDLIDELGEGPEGGKTIKQGTPAWRQYNSRVAELMKQGATPLKFRPLVYEDLIVKRRGEDGSREDEPIDLSPAEIGMLGPVLTFREA